MKYYKLKKYIIKCKIKTAHSPRDGGDGVVLCRKLVDIDFAGICWLWLLPAISGK